MADDYRSDYTSETENSRRKNILDEVIEVPTVLAETSTKTTHDLSNESKETNPDFLTAEAHLLRLLAEFSKKKPMS